MLTNFNSAPVTKPTTLLTPQDNQSMEISQTTHKHTHTHRLGHRHCMMLKQIAPVDVKLYFSTNSFGITKSSRPKYEKNAGECGNMVASSHFSTCSDTQRFWSVAQWTNWQWNYPPPECQACIFELPSTAKFKPRLKGRSCVVAGTLRLPPRRACFVLLETLSFFKVQTSWTALY